MLAAITETFITAFQIVKAADDESRSKLMNMTNSSF